MLQESLACGHQRAHRPEAFLRRGEKGATTSEYLVIAGVVVAIVLAVAGTFRTEISNAITILGCNISAGAGGGTGNCGGGSSASTAGSAGNPAGTGGSSGGTNPGQPLRPGQLVQVGPLGSGGGAAPALPGSSGVRPGPYVPPHLAGTAGGGQGGGVPSPTGSAFGQLPPGVMPPPAGQGPMAPGGPTATPGFPSTFGAALGDPWMTAGTAAEIWLDSGYNTGTSLHTTTARYGKWVGQGWSGGSVTDKVGAQPPEDALDALGQAHDFAYAAAEEAGLLYGEAEKNRLLALADEIGYREWQKLPQDPRQWQPPPKDLNLALTFRDRFPFVMRRQANEHESARLNSRAPSPEQLAALQARGPVTAADLQAQANARVAAWNVDRGKNMRANGSWK